MKKIAIFGAGLYGKKALKKLGSDRVECFIDNSSSKQGTQYCGKMVKSLDEVLRGENLPEVLIASTYSQSIVNQLNEYGVTEYSIFEDYLHGYYETDSLVVNPYVITKEAQSEQEWSNSEKMRYTRKAVYDAVENYQDIQPLFNHIEVETINRCNGYCTFCPVNRRNDPRDKAVMTEDLFKHIISQLAEIDYDGRFTTFSNNEPLLDERIVAWNKYARKYLPHARMHLFTNGTLFTLDKFIALTDVLDELVIDNYQQNLELIKPCREIEAYCKDHPELCKKVTIVLRKPNEILTSRGGTAPNRNELVQYGKDRCLLPYKQMIIRPDGKVSLCCNDAIGRYTLGDVSKETLLDIWYGPRFQMVRRCLYEGRENWGNCQFCDTFLMG